MAEAETAMVYARAPVTLEGRVLFLIRGVTAYPAEQRAQSISSRIKAMAADLALPANSLRLIETGDRINIVAGVSGDRFVMSVFDADAASEGSSRQQLAEAVQRKVVEAIVSYREARRPRALLINTGYALGATLIAALLMFASHRAFRLLEKAAEQRFKPQLEGRPILALQLFQSKQLWTALHSFLKALRVLSVLVIFYVYLSFVLDLYPWSQPLAQQLFAIFLNPLYTLGTSFLGALPNLAFLAILFVLTRYLLKATRLLFSGVNQGVIKLPNFDPDWALPTYKIIRLLVIAFALVVAYPLYSRFRLGRLQGYIAFPRCDFLAGFIIDHR
jgi:hypothetical protein